MSFFDNETLDLQRFRDAHEKDYDTALSEIQNGYKESHWMWYIFPQGKGLGHTPTSQYYAIQSVDEAYGFLEDPVLGKHLREISTALLNHDTNRPEDIFGEIDAMKLKSSMTLFHCVGGLCEENQVFYQVLQKYYRGELDELTINIIEEE